MKKLLLCAMLATLTSCGPPTAQVTAPSAHVPKGIAMCLGYDAVARCNKWSGESETDDCINPKGINEPQPIVPCASIKKVRAENASEE